MSEYGVVKCDSCKKIVLYHDEAMEVRMKIDKAVYLCFDCIEQMQLGQVCAECGFWGILTNGSYIDGLWICDNCQIARVNQ